MADNYTIDSVEYAADDLSGVMYPRVKLVLGEDGTNGGDLSATNPMPLGANESNDGSGVAHCLICDTSGRLIVSATMTAGTAATDLGKAVDDTAGETDTGIAALAVRDDSLTTLTPADGDYVHLRVDSTGRLWANVSNTVTVTASDFDVRDLSKASDSVACWANTVKDGSGTAYQPLVDSDGHLQVDILSGGGGGGTQYQIGAVAGATDTGTVPLAIRDDSLSTLGDSEGDWVALRVNANGALWVEDVGGGGSGGTQYQIGDVAGSTDTGTAALAIRDDILGTLADADGDWVGLRVNEVGKLWVTGGNTEFSMGVASGSSDAGIVSLAVRRDSLSTITQDDGDYASAQVNSQGAVWVAMVANTAKDGSGSHYQPVVDSDGHLQVDVAGTTAISYANASSTVTSVSASASSVELLASNAARRGATIYNDSTAILYVKFGTTASTSSFTYRMVANAHLEVPYGYTGKIDGIWASATGAARITEIEE